MYKVYTEDTGSDVGEKLAANYFESFTVFKGIGCWRNKFEKSLVFEIDTDSRGAVYSFAQALRKELGQQAVLVVELGSTSVLI